MIDDLGWNDVSFRNTSDLSSPNIDTLALGGVRLERYYTHNLCSPSRTAFLSGRFSSTIGMAGTVIGNGYADQMPQSIDTVADRLHRGGWKTAAFGKWDAGMTTWDYTPTCRGFDYFYGYWDASQDYYKHAKPALDLHENFEPVTDQAGTYSTHLYTAKAEEWLQKTVGVGGAEKSFVYLAYQAMHAPIEAPPEYVGSAHCRGVTTQNKRNVFCGMMAALDEGIGNVTARYKQLGIWNETLVVLSTDNGGHVGASGNNAPLRGEKSTDYEGGVRGTSFMHWPGLAPALAGTATDDVVHVSDWLPTFVGGVAGLPLEQDAFPHGLDGVDQWAALTDARHRRRAGPARGNAVGIVHQAGGCGCAVAPSGLECTSPLVHQESYFERPYKLVRYKPTVYNNNRYECVDFECSYGWNPLPGSGRHAVGPPAAENGTNASAPGNALAAGGTWLFNVFDDPLEQHDLSQELPSVVARLARALAAYTARPGAGWAEQTVCPKDPLSNPNTYFDGVWTPWRGSREPSCNAGGNVSYCVAPAPPAPPTPPPAPTPPTPPPPGQPEGDLNGGARSSGSVCSVTGWCSGPGFSGPPLQARVLLDGALAANGTAAVHRAVAGAHGFVLQVDCAAYQAGQHRFQVQCFYPYAYAGASQQQQWFQLKGSPFCTKDGQSASCPQVMQ
eukprot:g3564.t1